VTRHEYALRRLPLRTVAIASAHTITLKDSPGAIRTSRRRQEILAGKGRHRGRRIPRPRNTDADAPGRAPIPRFWTIPAREFTFKTSSSGASVCGSCKASVGRRFRSHAATLRRLLGATLLDFSNGTPEGSFEVLQGVQGLGNDRTAWYASLESEVPALSPLDVVKRAAMFRSPQGRIAGEEPVPSCGSRRNTDTSTARCTASGRILGGCDTGLGEPHPEPSSSPQTYSLRERRRACSPGNTRPRSTAGQASTPSTSRWPWRANQKLKSEPLNPTSSKGRGRACPPVPADAPRPRDGDRARFKALQCFSFNVKHGRDPSTRRSFIHTHGTRISRGLGETDLRGKLVPRSTRWNPSGPGSGTSLARGTTSARDGEGGAARLDAVIAVSRDMKEDIRKRIESRASKVTVIHNGVDRRSITREMERESREVLDPKAVVFS